VEIINVAGVVGVAEAALQLAFAGSPDVHASVTDDEKLPTAITGIVYVTEFPAGMVALAGELVIVPNLKSGAGFTLKFTLFEVWLPSVTVTGNVPTVATSAAVTVAVSEVGWPAVFVVRAVPLRFTTEFVEKFEPFTVRVNCAEPAIVEVGEIELIFGVAGFTVKFLLFEVLPLSETVTG
jgi:hypothetical protein